MILNFKIFEQVNEIEAIKNEIDDYVFHEHTATQIKNFLLEVEERTRDFQIEDRKEIKQYLLDKVKEFKIRKFPNMRNPNNDIYVVPGGNF